MFFAVANSCIPLHPSRSTRPAYSYSPIRDATGSPQDPGPFAPGSGNACTITAAPPDSPHPRSPFRRASQVGVIHLDPSRRRAIRPATDFVRIHVDSPPRVSVGP